MEKKKKENKKLKDDNGSNNIIDIMTLQYNESEK